MKKAGKYIALAGILSIGAGFLLTLVLFFGFHDEIMQHADELSIGREDFEWYFHEDEYHDLFDHDSNATTDYYLEDIQKYDGTLHEYIDHYKEEKHNGYQHENENHNRHNNVV